MNGATLSGTSSNDVITVASQKFKLCRVCGDVARCYHFGGLCCASCKAFFRRSVENDSYKPYRCHFGESCKIDVMSRKQCSHCRLKRCLAIGMDKKWFMPEEMRVELKLKAARKSRNNRQPPMTQQCRPDAGHVKVSSTLAEHEMAEIQMLIRMCRRAYEKEVVPEAAVEGCNNPFPSERARTALIFAMVIRRTIAFLESVPQLQHLNPETQKHLLREHGTESLVVLSSLTFDPVEGGWNTQNRSLMLEPRPIKVTESDFDRLHGEDVKLKHFGVVNSLLSLHADQPIIVLLSLIVLFMLDGKRQPLGSDTADIIATQQHFITLLRRYLEWKLNNACDSHKLFTIYVLKLCEVQKAGNLLQDSRLRLSDAEIQLLGKQLDGFHLSKQS